MTRSPNKSLLMPGRGPRMARAYLCTPCSISGANLCAIFCQVMDDASPPVHACDVMGLWSQRSQVTPMS